MWGCSVMLDFSEKRCSCTCGTVRESLLTIAGATPSIWPGRRAFTDSTGRDTMRMPLRATIGGIVLILANQAMGQTTPTVAAVNNNDIIRVQRPTSDLTTQNPRRTL